MRRSVKAKIPRRLKIEPLLEAIWELRFEGDPAAGGALPGMLFEKLTASGRKVNIETLPLASVPQGTRAAQEPLRYAPTSVLRYDNYAIFTGDRAAALSVTRPYPGWREYGQRISELADLLRSSGMIKNPERCAVKYLDFFECKPDGVFRTLRADIRIGGMRPDPGEFKLQMLVKRDGFDGIIQIMNPAVVTVDAQTRQGLVTDVQVTWKNPPGKDFWREFPSTLHKAKLLCHELFFRLLAAETLKAHKPVYED